MVDIVGTLNGTTERASGDATVLLVAGVGLLALLVGMMALLPLDTAPDPAAMQALFVP